jgi:hypothetical protein
MRDPGMSICLSSCVLLLTLSVSACAQTREVQDRNLAEYMEYAGEPVDHFRFWRLTSWELVGPQKLVVWPTLKEAYLLTVDQPCTELEWAKAISLTSSAHTVSARFDYVDVGRERCRIMEIRPIDYAQYRKNRRASE